LSEQGPRGICGSLLAVRLARHHDVPVELLASEAPQGGGADRDVSTFLGQRICPAGVSVHPIESEIMPWEIFKDAGGVTS